MSFTLSLDRSEYSVVWLPVKPLAPAALPPPRDKKNGPIPGRRAVPAVPALRAVARFLVAMCIGVAATLTWQSYSKAAKQLAADSSLQVVGSAAAAGITANQIVPAAFAAVPPPDQPDLAILRQNFDRLAASQRQISLGFVQLASAQEQMMRDITRLQQTGQYPASNTLVSNASVPLPRPAPAEMRKHASRPAAKAASAGPSAHHAMTSSMTSSASTGASSPLPVQLARFDGGHKRTQSSVSDLRGSTSDPLGESLMFARRNLISALSKITGIPL